MKVLEKFSMGMGDRFGHQGKAQLKSLVMAKAMGLNIVPVWNKSHREHVTIGTHAGDVRLEADAAVESLGWTDSYYVDADHINMSNVDLFVDHCDFFTIDVADEIGMDVDEESLRTFVQKYTHLTGSLMIPGVEQAFEITEPIIETIGRQYLRAIQEAGKIYRHIERVKGKGNFITEISIDETDTPQSPVDLLFILAAISDENIPIQTIAPKFSGRFNKGVDYVGDVNQFEKEFNEDIAICLYAIEHFGLPTNLKLSVHSGSDKFLIYESINKAIRKFDVGLHLKTAGTTWLEELIGLAMAGGEGLKIAQDIYAEALGRFDELCDPYASVIDIDQNLLPTATDVSGWSGETFAATLRHDGSCPEYNNHFRQLLHVGYKIAAEMGSRYLEALKKYETLTASNVTANFNQRHIEKIFKVSRR